MEIGLEDLILKIGRSILGNMNLHETIINHGLE
jgi:hypothetical protein